MAGLLQPASYSPVRMTISAVAGQSGADRWVMTGGILLVGSCYLVTAAGLTGIRASARALLAVAYGSAAVTAVSVALLGWLFAETRDGSVLGLAERLTTSISTCWPFVIGVGVRRMAPPAGAGHQRRQEGVRSPGSGDSRVSACGRRPAAAAPVRAVRPRSGHGPGAWRRCCGHER